MPSEELPPDWEAQLARGVVVAATVSRRDIEGHLVTVSKASIGLREVWLVAIADQQRRVSFRGPGNENPSETLLNFLVGQHRATILGRNAGNN